MPDGRDIAIRELMRQLDEALAENERCREAIEQAEASLRACVNAGDWLEAKFYFDRQDAADRAALTPTTQEDRQ